LRKASQAAKLAREAKCATELAKAADRARKAKLAKEFAELRKAAKPVDCPPNFTGRFETMDPHDI